MPILERASRRAVSVYSHHTKRVMKFVEAGAEKSWLQSPNITHAKPDLWSILELQCYVCQHSNSSLLSIFSDFPTKASNSIAVHHDVFPNSESHDTGLCNECDKQSLSPNSQSLENRGTNLPHLPFVADILTISRHHLRSTGLRYFNLFFSPPFRGLPTSSGTFSYDPSPTISRPFTNKTLAGNPSSNPPFLQIIWCPRSLLFTPLPRTMKKSSIARSKHIRFWNPNCISKTPSRSSYSIRY